MNKYYLIILTFWFVVSSNKILGQNLVLNPSFENTSGTCSGFASGESFNQVSNWDNANSNTPGDSCSSPDLFSPCNVMPLVGGPGPMYAPNNLLGNQCAKSGTRYAGIITNEMGSIGQSYREYIQGTLSSPLQAGQTYCVSFYVSLADAVNYATNNIGVYFSNTHYLRDACAQGSLISVTPQLNYDCSPILETSNWVRLSWNYVASGGESHFMIGNFFNDANTQIVGTGQTTINPYAYYYIDDVSVVTGACDFAEIMLPNSNSCSNVGSDPSDPFTTFCTSDPAINLVAQQGTNCTTPATPGTWAGNGITDATNGTFNPATAGTGTHTITYTTQGGYVATVKILVSDCLAITVCKEANGDLTASGGTAPFSWQNEVITQDCSACMMGCNIPPNCAVNVTSWSTFATGATIPTPSTYPIKIKDGVGTSLDINSASDVQACNTTSCPTITVSLTNQSNVKCKGGNDGSATVSASGGTAPYTFNWSPGNLTGATQNNLSADSYSITVTDLNNCPSTFTVVITEPSTILTASSSKTDICGTTNGTASAAANGGTSGYNYSWSNGATTQNISNLTAGNYTVTVTDANNCTATSQVSITANSNTVPQFTNPGPICAGTTFTLPNISNNGITGAWSPAINNTQTTTYTFVVDNNQCAVDTTLDVIVNNSPNTPSVSSVAPTCTQQGASIMDNYDPNATYTFTPPGPSVGAGNEIIGMVNGTNYTVSSSINGCASNSSGNFSNGDPLSAATTPTVTTTPPSCISDGTSTINNYSASNTYTFTPAGPTAGTGGVINNMTIGQSYTMTISNGTCSSSPSAPFSNAAQLDALDAPVISTTAASCTAGGTATIDNYDANLTYTFSPTGPTVANGVISNLTAGQSYTVVANDANCTSPQSNAFTTNAQFTPPTVIASADTSICQGNSVTLTASGALTYSWDNNLGNSASQSVTPNATTTYTVTGTDANGCTDTDQVIVSVLSASGIDVSVDTTSGCAPLTVHFNNQTIGANTYSWDFGDGTTSTLANPDHTYMQDSCYTVTVTADNGQGCATTITMDNPICVYPNPTAAFTASTYEITSYSSDVRFINNSKNASSYNWSFGDVMGNSNQVNPTYTYNQDDVMNYTVVLIAKNEYGCADTTKAIIKMKEEIIFFVPNTFTPDGDEFNNTFKPTFADGFDAFSYEMLVFNRWGEIIFETHNTEIGWDGTYKGKICQDGTYVWKIYVKKRDTVEEIEKHGHVTLLK